MIQHLEAILIILGQLAVWAFYALFVVAGVVMAINFGLRGDRKLWTRWVKTAPQGSIAPHRR